VDVVFEHADGRHKRVRKVSPVQTRRGAEEYERQLRGELLEGRFGRKEARFDEFAEEFDEIHIKGELKWSTQIRYRSTLKTHLLPTFGTCNMDEIESAQVSRLRAQMRAAGLSASTIRNTLGVLSRMLHLAKEWGYLREVPHIAFPKVPSPRFRFLSEEERRALLANAGDYWYGPIYFGLMTGCRMGEIFALERDQLDLANATVRIDRAVFRGKVALPKHDKVRTIDLSPGLVEFLRRHLRVVPLKSRLVFPTAEGTIRQERKADQGLRRACKRAGIEPCGWHVLRHTFASHLVMKGVPPQVVQELLGHSRIDETMRYSHLSPHMKRGAVVRLDDLDLKASESLALAPGQK